MQPTDHVYLEETLELADEYLLTAYNEHDYYKLVERWFKYNGATIADSSFPYSPKGTLNHEYRIALAKVPHPDKHMFACLVRNISWRHYQEEFAPDSTQLVQEIKVHLKNAETHFEKVEIYMNTLTRYENEPSKKIHLIHGRPADEWTEAQLLAKIRETRQAQADIEDVAKDSQRMSKKHAEYSANIDVYVKALDALK